MAPDGLVKIMSHLFSITQASSEWCGIRLLSGKASVILVVAGMLNFSGCDPVRTTSQNITITVEDGQGVPIPDAKVRIKESLASWQSWSPVANEGERSYLQTKWENDLVVPWCEGLTNPQGKAVVKFEVTALDWTTGSEPSAKRDIVSNRQFIVKLQTQDAEDETLVVMRTGMVNRGKRYRVRLEAIEKPRYVGEEAGARELREAIVGALIGGIVGLGVGFLRHGMNYSKENVKSVSVGAVIGCCAGAVTGIVVPGNTFIIVPIALVASIGFALSAAITSVVRSASRQRTIGK